MPTPYSEPEDRPDQLLRDWTTAAQRLEQVVAGRDAGGFNTGLRSLCQIFAALQSAVGTTVDPGAGGSGAAANTALSQARRLADAVANWRDDLDRQLHQHRRGNRVRRAYAEIGPSQGRALHADRNRNDRQPGADRSDSAPPR